MKLFDYIIAAIFISLGNIIRPEGIIIVFSLILFEIFRFKKKNIVDTIKKVSIFLIIYFFIGSSASFIIQKTGINPSGLNNTNPLWKFVLGFNHETCGYYTEDDVIYQSDSELEKEIIKQRIFSDPIKTANLLVCKVDHFWLLSDLSMESGAFSDKEFNLLGIKIKYSNIENVVLDLNQYIYLFTFLMSILGVIIKRKEIVKKSSLFFLILMIVTFFVYLLIEIQPRYSYFIHISIFILSAYGYKYLLDKIKILNNHIKDNYKKYKVSRS